MAFLDKALQLGKKVGETTASVAKSAASAAKEKSEQAIEIGKLRKDIIVENGRINKLYEEIGKHAFDIFNASKDFNLLEPLFAQITAGLEKIEECKIKIDEVKSSSGDGDGEVVFDEELELAEETADAADEDTDS